MNPHKHITAIKIAARKEESTRSVRIFIFSQFGYNKGIGFAARSNIVGDVYRQIRDTRQVRRGEICIHTQTITPLLSQALGLPFRFGIILDDVFPGEQRIAPVYRLVTLSCLSLGSPGRTDS